MPQEPKDLENLSANQKLLKQLKKEGVILAYLFGSQARGTAHQESDIDFGVLFDKKVHSKDYLRREGKLIEFFSNFYPKKEINIVNLNVASPLLKQVVILEGKLLYQKDDLTRINFEIQTLHEYEDMKHFDDIYNYYMSQRIKEGAFGKLILNEGGKHD